jgi:hypothetical protein
MFLSGCGKTDKKHPVVYDDSTRYELTANETDDSLYLRIMDVSRNFVIDTLHRQPVDFKYELLQFRSDNEYKIIVELYDKKAEVIEKSEFADSTIYIRLNNVRNLHFDSAGNYKFNMWVADTDEELIESNRMMKEYFNSQEYLDSQKK